MGLDGLEGEGGGRNNMFHVCFMYVSDFWFIFQFLVVRIAGLSESLKAQRTLREDGLSELWDCQNH